MIETTNVIDSDPPVLMFLLQSEFCPNTDSDVTDVTCH